MLKRLMLATALVAAPAFAHANDDTAAMATALPAAATPATEASAGPQNTLQVVWTVFLGGINLGTVGLKSSFEGSNYAAVSRLKTAGVVNSFYASVIDASAVGTVDTNTLHPLRYDSDYNGEKSKQKVSLAFVGGGVLLSSNPPYNVDRFPVTEEQKRDTLDPLSAIIYSVTGISATPDKPCGDTVRIFDGRRRYDVELTYVGKDNVSTAGPYSGPAIKCEMSYRQIAGFKPNLTKNNVLPTITVWFAALPTKEAGPMKSFLVAVKLMAETPFGAAVAHARRITIDGEEKSR
ncbi:MAG: DUF3108 domain-containing protein [Alphaproteobacteria bacterium]|nr:DUF3108 domain-containing protein [Alphaproteobacteria bacterium]